MKISKKILIFIMITILAILPLLNIAKINVYAVSKANTRAPVKAAVFLYRFDDIFVSLVKQSLENIQKENEEKIEFTFFDGKGNQTIQNEQIDAALQEDFELFVLSLADARVEMAGNAITQIVQKNIPLILYLDPTEDLLNFIKTSQKPIIIGTDAKQSGTLEGQILARLWNSNKDVLDKNKDNVLQYIMLHGENKSPAAIERTKYSVLALNDAGINTEQVALSYCNWNKEDAKTAVDSLFLRYGNKIEAIISNNDAMAIGAIEALQKYGYNSGNKEKFIPVVGVDAIPEAQDLIKKGFMTGTVTQDPKAIADAIYKVGMNLVEDKSPLEGTDYKFDYSGVEIHIPYKEYVP